MPLDTNDPGHSQQELKRRTHHSKPLWAKRDQVLNKLFESPIQVYFGYKPGAVELKLIRFMIMHARYKLIQEDRQYLVCDLSESRWTSRGVFAEKFGASIHTVRSAELKLIKYNVFLSKTEHADTRNIRMLAFSKEFMAWLKTPATSKPSDDISSLHVMKNGTGPVSNFISKNKAVQNNPIENKPAIRAHDPVKVTPSQDSDSERLAGSCDPVDFELNQTLDLIRHEIGKVFPDQAFKFKAWSPYVARGMSTYSWEHKSIRGQIKGFGDLAFKYKQNYNRKVMKPGDFLQWIKNLPKWSPTKTPDKPKLRIVGQTKVDQDMKKYEEYTDKKWNTDTQQWED